MCISLSHRGPDDDGFFIDEKIGIGIRRLSVIDVEGGHQPIHNEDETIWTVFNGEIYNFISLRQKLESSGHHFYTRTDTEVLVHLYEEYGLNCLSHLDGMFAFAIWDKRTRRLFIARDKVGEKPLYYTEIGETLVFSSELRSIVKYPLIKKEIDKKSLNDYLFFGFVPSPNSILKYVKKLPAANYLIADDKGLIMYNYWHPKYDRKLMIDEKGAKFMVEKTLKRAVEERLVSDVPLGVFLSGGIDSGIIAAMIAQNINPEKVMSFTLGFLDKKYDESSNALEVASFLGINSKLEIFESKAIIEIVKEALGTIDEPLSDPSYIPTYVLSKFARKYVTVVLSGDGGDELFGGYPKYSVVKIAALLDRFPNSIKLGLVNSILTLTKTGFLKDYTHTLRRFLIGMRYQMDLRGFIWVSVFMPEEVDKVTLHHSNTEDIFSSVKEHARRFVGTDIIDKTSYLDLKTFLADMFLAKVDIASMNCSLEVRCPFFDAELLELSSKLDSNLKIRKFQTKYLLRKVAESYLPKSVINLKKRGFGIPLNTLVTSYLKDLVYSYLEPNYIQMQGLFNSDYLQRIINEHFSGKEDNSAKIWRLIVFQEWYNRIILAA